jgi:hypothetical protein
MPFHVYGGISCSCKFDGCVNVYTHSDYKVGSMLEEYQYYNSCCCVV